MNWRLVACHSTALAGSMVLHWKWTVVVVSGALDIILLPYFGWSGFTGIQTSNETIGSLLKQYMIVNCDVKSRDRTDEG